MNHKNKTMRAAVASLSFIALAACGLLGCGARTEVVRDKVLAQLDKVLGEMDVKEKEIEIKRRDLTSELQNLRVKKAQSDVRMELLVKKQDSSKQELQKLKKGLERVQPKLEEASENSKIDLNGREVSADELNRMASELVSRVRSKTAEIQSQQTSIDALKRTSQFLGVQEKAAKDMLSKLDSKISELKDKRTAIDAVRTANSMAGDDSSLMDKLASLSKDVDNLFIDVESSIRVEEDKMTDLINESTSADLLLTDPGSDINSTMNEIDLILGSGEN